MQVKTLMKKIKKLHDEMRELCLESGIQEQHYDAMIRHLDEKGEEQLANLFEWLKVMRSTPYEEVKKVYNLLPKERWEMYKTFFGQDSMEEQVHLRRKQEKLRTYWRTRINETNSKKIEKSSESMCIQSEQAGDHEDHSGSE